MLKNLLGRHPPPIGKRYSCFFLNTAKLALGTDEKALMREIEDSDDIVLERRLEIIRNKKGVNAREVGNHEPSDEGSGLIYTLSNGRGVTNGYAFG